MITWIAKLLNRPVGPSQTGAWVPTHRHKKGGVYRVVMEAILEADRSDVVVYDDAQGTVWVRSKAEFYDGRFTKID